MSNARNFLLIVSIVILAAAVSVQAGPDMQEGLWQITTTFEMPGMPMKMPPMTHTQCITQDDLVPQARQQPGQECRVSNYKVVGNTVSYDVVCKAEGNEMEGHGEATYSGDSMSGSMQMTMTGQQQMQMTYHYTGKRTGPCN